MERKPQKMNCPKFSCPLVETSALSGDLLFSETSLTIILVLSPKLTTFSSCSTLTREMRIFDVMEHI